MSDNKDFWKDIMGDDFDINDYYNKKSDNAGDGNESDQAASLKGGLPISRVDKSGETIGKAVPPSRPAGNKREDDLMQPASKEPLPSGQQDFDVEIDFEEGYDEVDDYEERPIRRNREKRSGCLGGFMYFAFIIGVSFLLACVGWLAATDVLALGKADTAVEVTIPQDFTVDQVADILYSNDIIKYKALFKIYAGFSDAEKKMSAGTYELNTSFDYRALVYGMSASGGTKVVVNVTIPEGYTLSQIFKLLDKNSVCTEEDLWDMAANYDFEYDFLDPVTLGEKKRLEGYLFPDTYIFYVGDDATRVISKMLTNFDGKFTDDYKARAEALGYTVDEIVIIASMIEKEAANDAERGDIASVIYNRLKSASFPKLQIDATIYYAIADSGDEFSKDYDSPYNTYKYDGLPIGPISNPGLQSIKAALYPSDTNYYYYGLNTDGVHSFFNSYDSFQTFLASDKYGG
ncbi:MAG: endolytic transglycosylase MltG [Oscillospiraceae bacterium]